MSLNSSPAIPMLLHPPTDTVLTSAGQPDTPRPPTPNVAVTNFAPLFRTGFAFSHSFKPLFTDDTTMLFFFESKHG
ncbi:hypothetical protein AHAS_Ahas04G0197000 [Arachis hypogaea]